MLFTHWRTAEFLLKAHFIQNFNKPEYVFEPQFYDSLKSKYHSINEETEVRKGV